MIGFVLFLTCSILVGTPSIYLLMNPDFANKHETGSIIDLIHGWLPSPWDRRFIQGVATAGVSLSLGLLWLAISLFD